MEEKSTEALADGTLKPNVLKMSMWKDAGGQVWTLGQQRLGAFRVSGLKRVPIQWVDPIGESGDVNKKWRYVYKT